MKPSNLHHQCHCLATQCAPILLPLLQLIPGAFTTEKIRKATLTDYVTKVTRTADCDRTINKEEITGHFFWSRNLATKRPTFLKTKSRTKRNKIGKFHGNSKFQHRTSPRPQLKYDTYNTALMHCNKLRQSQFWDIRKQLPTSFTTIGTTTNITMSHHEAQLGLTNKLPSEKNI